MTEGSNALYKATYGMAYIKSVKLLIPHDWDPNSNVASDFATSEVYEVGSIIFLARFWSSFVKASRLAKCSKHHKQHFFLQFSLGLSFPYFGFFDPFCWYIWVNGKNGRKVSKFMHFRGKHFFSENTLVKTM